MSLDDYNWNSKERQTESNPEVKPINSSFELPLREVTDPF
jgi:hypothetical protein